MSTFLQSIPRKVHQFKIDGTVFYGRSLTPAELKHYHDHDKQDFDLVRFGLVDQFGQPVIEDTDEQREAFQQIPTAVIHEIVHQIVRLSFPEKKS